MLIFAQQWLMPEMVHNNKIQSLAWWFIFPLLFVGPWLPWQLHHWSWEGDSGKDECNPAELPEEPGGGDVPAAVTGVWHQTPDPRELPHQWVVLGGGRSVLAVLGVKSELQVECTALSHTLPVLLVHVLNYFSELLEFSWFLIWHGFRAYSNMKWPCLRSVLSY